MRRGRALLLVLLLAGCAGAHASTRAATRAATHATTHATPRVGRVALVHPGDVLAPCHADGAVAGSQVEPSLASAPGDRTLLLAAWQQDRFPDAAALGIAVAVSRDGGRSWRAQALPRLTRCGGGRYGAVSDPQAAIGPDGRMYVSTIAVGPGGQAILVSHSEDGGRSWSAPVAVTRVAGAGAVLDKPALLADSRRAGTAYVVWVRYPRAPGASIASLRVDTAYLARTTDGGRTFSAPSRVYGANTENQNHVPLELADGTLVDVFAEGHRLSPPGRGERVRAIASRDGGRTWSRPVTIGSPGYSVVAGVRASSQDVAAFAVGDSVYAAWESTGHPRSRIAVARSLDGGRAWSRLPDPASGPEPVVLPEVAAGSGGEVVASWYRVVALRGGARASLMLGTLGDGARRWRVQRVFGPFALSGAPPSPEGRFLGDYAGLAPARCGFRMLDSVVVGRAGARVVSAPVC